VCSSDLDGVDQRNNQATQGGDRKVQLCWTAQHREERCGG